MLPHAFACWLLVCFVMATKSLFVSGEKANVSVRAVLQSITESFGKQW